MATKDQLLHFMARRKWDVLAAEYNCTRYTMLKCIRNNRRPETLTPEQWEDVLVYRQEWHKANNELREMK